MSYPRNAASPPIIAVGAIYLLADGTIQTTGASARVKTGSGAWGTAAGTLACDSTSGVWTYTPTQGETDAESFLVAVYKSASTSAQVTIATSASATAGYSGVDWSKLTAATSTVNLSGTTISTSQSVASVTARVTANVDQWNSVTVTGMPMPTYTQPTGFLAATFPATVSSYAGGAVASVTGNVGGNVAGSVGSIAGVTFPTNFGAILINASGHLSRVTLVDTTTTNTDMRGTDGAALASAWTATRAGYLDSVLLAQNSNQRTVQVTGGGSGHIAADVHAMQADVLTDAAIATSAVTKVQAGLATINNQTTINTNVLSRLAASAYTAPDNSGIAAIKVVTDRVNTGLVADGAVWQFTVNMLENGPGGAGGGSATVENQELILDQLDLIQGKTDLITSSGAITGLLAGAVLEPGTIEGFPTTLKIGDSYTAANGRAIDIPIVDTDGIPLDSAGSLDFSSASVTFTISRAKETSAARIVTGIATVIDPPGTGTANAPYVRVELSSSETAKGLLGYRYTATLKFTWAGTGTDVMSFESSADITFDN